MIFKGNETPYAQEMAKKEASNTSVGELIVSDASLNKSIIDYISQVSKSQETLRIIDIIIRCYNLPDEFRKTLIRDILKEEKE